MTETTLHLKAQSMLLFPATDATLDTVAVETCSNACGVMNGALLRLYTYVQYVRPTICVHVCVSVTLHLTSRMSVRLTNDATY